RSTSTTRATAACASATGRSSPPGRTHPGSSTTWPLTAARATILPPRNPSASRNSRPSGPNATSCTTSKAPPTGTGPILARARARQGRKPRPRRRPTDFNPPSPERESPMISTSAFRTWLVLLVVSLIVQLGLAPEQARAQAADLIVHNGKVVTVDR